MDTAINTRIRNQTLECCKLVAACFVVFLHIPFPGNFGVLVVCLSRFAVPLFFAVSGWFSHGSSPDKLLRRLKHILLLELTGDLLYIGWRCIREVLSGEILMDSILGQLPDGQTLKMWLLWNVDPFGGHLWYLSATALCYILLWAYICLRKDRRTDLPLYIAGIPLLAVCFAMSEFSGFTGIHVDYRIYRSGIFLGVPMFLMGMCLRQYGRSFRGLSLLASGILLSILERQFFGSNDIYVGSVLMAAGILLLADRHPSVPGWLRRGSSYFGGISTTVYLIHLLLQEIYGLFFREKLELLAGTLELWLRPVLILVSSLLIGFLWELLKSCKIKKSTL